jgi:hypothetical protein
MPTVNRFLCALLLAGCAAPAAADSWTKTSDVGASPVSKTTREQHDFSATGSVDVRQIGSRVEVRAGAGNTVEFAYERRAATQQDFDCETLKVERSHDQLRIWVEHRRERACRVVRADDTLRLTVPRGASVRVRDVGAEVSVDGVEGMVRIADVGGKVTIRGAQQLEATDIGDELTVEIARLGTGGIRITDIGDTVELSLPETVDARLRIGRVGDEIRGPGLRLDSDDEDEDSYEAQLGNGGPLIRIEDVGDTVEIRGPRLGRARSD